MGVRSEEAVGRLFGVGWSVGGVGSSDSVLIDIAGGCGRGGQEIQCASWSEDVLRGACRIGGGGFREWNGFGK